MPLYLVPLSISLVPNHSCFATLKCPDPVPPWLADKSIQGVQFQCSYASLLRCPSLLFMWLQTHTFCNPTVIFNVFLFQLISPWLTSWGHTLPIPNCLYYALTKAFYFSTAVFTGGFCYYMHVQCWRRWIYLILMPCTQAQGAHKVDEAIV